MTKQLRNLLQSTTLEDTTEQGLKKKMKDLAVLTIHAAVHKSHLHSLQQTQTETFKEFVARVTNIASNCKLQKTCPADGCNTEVSFLDETVYDVALGGIRDPAVRQKIVTLCTMDTITNLQQLITYVTAEENSIRETENFNVRNIAVSAVKSTYKNNKFNRSTSYNKCSNCGGAKHGDGSQAEKIKSCPAHGKMCSKCNKPNHFSRVCRSSQSKAAAVHDTAFIEQAEGDTDTTAAPIMFFAIEAMDPVTDLSQLKQLVSTFKASGDPVTAVVLPHSIHSVTDGWLQSRPQSSPTHPVTLTVDKSSYIQLGLNLPRPELANRTSPRVRADAVFDTGAQLNLCPLSTLKQLNIQEQDLFKVSTNVSSAHNKRIQIAGGMILNVTAVNTATGKHFNSKQLFYVSPEVNDIYLSKNCCQDLQTIPVNFPAVGSCPPTPVTAAVASATEKVSGEKTTAPDTGPGVTIPQCSNNGVTSGSEPCSCPRRTLPPSTVPPLPCAPTEENLPIIKKHILKHFAASSFNTCQRQPLPMMSGSEPLKLFIDPAAKPVAIHTPSQVPLHWKQAVNDALDMDERLGVIEKVKENTPSKWISRMHVVAKHDGSPRRVVDFQNLNEHAPRQTHHTEAPWALAASVPPNTKKSVLDCWHGYHSVEIAPEDRHYTTFLTEKGTYQYRSVPMGFIAAGDGYTMRVDKVTTDFKNKRKCNDDHLLFDQDIETNYKTVCEFLIQCGNHGIIFNPRKFQFAESEVQFVGFTIDEKGIRPTSDFVQSILNFPTPRNITDVRSWFGAVGQVSFAFASAPDMLPFKHLLSTKAPFAWSPDLEAAFQKSKMEIIKQIDRGVRSFDVNKPTALATDWSKWASGFWLTQKHCSCYQEIVKPGCCANGWQTVFCGSKFNTPAESRYAPIEGESMSAAWAMNRCKYYLMGLPSFQLCVDHKPLLKIFSNTSLGNIDNPRILRSKQKTLMFKFTTVHIPGKEHVIPDCMSRRWDSPHAATATVPSSINLQADISNILPGYQDTLAAPSWVAPPPGGARPGQVAALLGETPAVSSQFHNTTADLTLTHMSGNTSAMMAGLTADTWDTAAAFTHEDSGPEVITWERLEAAAKSSPTYRSLHSIISSGAPDDINLWPEEVKIYYHHRHVLVPVGPVLLLHDRPLIPVALRQEVLDHLHSGHAGVTGMQARATDSVYWPNLKQDLVRTRAECRSCQHNAPSNPSAPPEPVIHPLYPFHSICSDFFSIGGMHYLAIVDRYSNWLSIFTLPKDDSKHLIQVLRQYFTRWGIPVVLTTDGASVYTSQEMKTFLARYGVKHRVSAAYYPRGNKRSEVAVKSARRLVMDNLSPRGSVDTDRLARALLSHRNQPDPTSGLSPSMVIFGRMLRDHLPLQQEKFQPRAEWRMEADQREKALMKRHVLKHEQLSSHSRPLPPLAIGDCVAIQDKTVPGKAGKWTKTGIVTDSLGFQNYEIKIDGSNVLSTRHRTHLRKIIPYTNSHMSDGQQSWPSFPPSSPPPTSLPSPPRQSPSPHTPPSPSPTSTAPPPPSTPNRHPKRVKEKWVLTPTRQDIEKIQQHITTTVQP